VPRSAAGAVGVLRRLLIVGAMVGTVTLVAVPPLRSPAGTANGSLVNVEPVADDASSSLPSQALYGWGSDDWGQLANGTSGEGTPTPVSVPGMVAQPGSSAFHSVAAGGSHSLGLTVDGQVYAWGADFSGQLGIGSLDEASTPQGVTVPGGPVVAVAAGSAYSLALTATGQVYAWGANLFGQLGNGTASNADSPVLVSMPTGVTVTAIAAGGDHSLALTSTGQVYAWGSNIYGQVGDGTTVSRDTPVPVAAPGGATITAIAAGTGHSLALTSTGQVYAWGFNASGQLGDGTTADRSTMVPVSLPTGTTITSIATGSSHSLGLTSTGAVLVWGSNAFGQLDSALVGNLPVDSPVPLQPLGLPPLTTFVAVAGGLNSSYALTSAGVPWVWGGNAYGQLGAGSPGLDGVLPLAMATLPPGTLASGPDASAAFLITRADQSLSFPALPAPTYGDPPVDVAPTSDSGLSVSITASGSCAGSVVHLYLVAAGLCSLTATQPGNLWYYPATAAASFEVTPAPLSVVPDDVTATVGAVPTTFDYQLSGFKNQDSSALVSGVASCTSPASDTSLEGTYPITCAVGTLSAANYSLVPGGPGRLTIVAAASGYAVVGADGSIWAMGPERAQSAPAPPSFGSMAGHRLNAPIVGAAFTPRHDGYWLVASDGGVFAFGAARFYGSMGGTQLNKPIVGLAATPDGGGYWMVAADGGIFAFGDAPFFGSTGNIVLNQPIVGMTATPDGGGYWMVAADGGIFAFGDAPFLGSTGGQSVEPDIVGMAAAPGGGGYWMTTRSGAVFSYGQATFEGSLRYIDLSTPVVGITPTYDGHGYWLASADGGVFAFGDAAYYGRVPASPSLIEGII
jgi:alpha-tubulin suppressor-like RCC1 family protein